jgi:hypothetical protein
MSEILYLLEMMNGADGISDIEGKATRVGASERGQQTSFKSLQILIRRGDMRRNVRLRLTRMADQARGKVGGM